MRDQPHRMAENGPHAMPPRIRGVFAAIALTAAAAHAAEVGFTAGPTAERRGDGARLRFTVSAPTDVEVAVLDADGRVVRHLAAGVLGGENPPPAPLAPGLEQACAWDGRDDAGKPATGGPFSFRVSAGLRPRFDRFLLYEPDAMPAVSALAVGPAGRVYAFYQDPTANGNQGGHKVRILDPNARFIRQVLPFPADLPYDRVRATGAFRDAEGHVVPQVHNWHSLNYYPDTVLARGRSASRFHCPAVDARGRLYWVVTGGRLCAIDAEGGIPYETFLGPPLFPSLEYPGGPAALAVSSDGESLYVAGITDGRWSKARPVPCVYRVDLATRRAEVFLGDPNEPGKARDRFTAPRGLAAANGLLYVADPTAGRLAVFREADRSYVGEMSVTLPYGVQVHPRTNAVYVCSYVPEARPRGDGKCRIKDANLLKFAGWRAREPIARIALPTTGLSPNGGAHRIALDASSDPPRIYVPGLPYARPEDARWMSCYRDTPAGFERVELPRVDRPWGRGPRDMLVDRRRGDVYVKVSGEKWYHFDERTAEMRRLVQFPKSDGGPYSGAHGANLGIAPDGHYITHCWGKRRGLMRWTRDLRPKPWDGSDTHRTEWGGMMTFQLNYMAVRGEEIYLIKRTEGPHHLDVYGMDLKFKRRVVWNVRRGSCPRVDAEGNIYLTVPLRPTDRDLPAFFDGKLGPIPDYYRGIGEGHYWYVYMYGSLVKFPPAGGAFTWTESKRFKNDFAGLPDAIGEMPPRRFQHFQGGRYPHKPCEVRGAEWVRFGYSPYSETYPAGTPVCMCEGTGYDVDAWGRVFYPDVCRFRVAVVDAANNRLAAFGRYGNQDSGPGGRITRPPIPLAWPTYVAVSDTHAYVNDTIGMRVVRVALDHAASKTCAIP